MSRARQILPGVAIGIVSLSDQFNVTIVFDLSENVMQRASVITAQTPPLVIARPHEGWKHLPTELSLRMEKHS